MSEFRTALSLDDGGWVNKLAQASAAFKKFSDVVSKESAATTRAVSYTTDALMGKFPQAAKTAETSASGFARALSSVISPVGLVTTALVTMAGAAVAATRAVTENAEQVKRLQAVSGLTADEADNLADTFELLGVRGESLTNALFKMGQVLDAGGSEFAKLGVSARDSSGALKAEGQLLLEVRDRIASMGSASERSAALMQLFGRAGREMAAVFAMSWEEFTRWAERAGGISGWTKDAQDRSEAYSRSLRELGMRWDALAQKVGVTVLPALNAVLDVLNSLGDKAKVDIEVNVKDGKTPSGWDWGAFFAQLGSAGAGGGTGAFGYAAGRALFDKQQREKREALTADMAAHEQTLMGQSPAVVLPTEFDRRRAVLEAEARFGAVQRRHALAAASRQGAVSLGQLGETAAIQQELRDLGQSRAATESLYGERLSQAKGKHGDTSKEYREVVEQRAKALGEIEVKTKDTQAKLAVAARKEAEDASAAYARYADERQKAEDFFTETSRTVSLERTQIRGTEEQRFIASAQEEAQKQIAAIYLVRGETEQASELSLQVLANRDAKVAEFQRQRDSEAASALAEKIRGVIEAGETETERVERQYREQRNSFEQVLSEYPELYDTVMVALRRLDEDRAGQLERARNDEIARDSRKWAELVDIHDAGIRRQRLLEGAKVNELYRRQEEEVRALETVNEAGQRFHDLALRRSQAEARAAGDAAGFFATAWQRAALRVTDAWGNMERAATGFFDTAHRGLTDFYESLFDSTKKVEDVWKNVLSGVKRAIAEFLSSETIRGLSQLGTSVFGSLFGGSGAPASAGGSGVSSAFGSLGSIAALAGVVGIAAAGYGQISNNPQMSTLGGGAGILGGAYGLYSAGTTFQTGGMLGIASEAGLQGLTSTAGLASGFGLAGGVLSLAGGMTNSPNLQRAGALVNIGSAGLGLYGAVSGLATGASLGATTGAAGFLAAEAAATGGAAAAGAGAAGGSMAAVSAAMPYIAAAIVSALAIYNQTQLASNWKDLPEGTKTGARVGAYLGPGSALPMLLGADADVAGWFDPIFTYVGSLIGGFFGKPDIPHDVREQMELGKKLSPAANQFMSSVGGSKSLNELYSVLKTWQTGYVGGTSPVAMNVGFEGPGGPQYNYLGLYNPPGGQALGQSEFFQQVRTRPDELFAMMQAGVTPSKLDPLNQAMKATIVARVKALDELQAAIVDAVTELTKVSLPPADTSEALDRQVAQFRDAMKMLADSADAQLKVMADRLLGLTDPQMIIEQAAAIRKALEDRYNGEVDLVEKWSAAMERAADAWRSVTAAAEEQIAALTLGNQGPTNPSERLGLSRVRFREAVEAYDVGESPQLAARVMAMVGPYLDAAAEMFARPSSEYQAIFQETIGALEDIRGRGAAFEGTISDAIGDLFSGTTGPNNLEELRALNEQKLREALEGLRQDLANVFAAQGFNVPGSNLNPEILAKIADERTVTLQVLKALEEAARNAPADQLSLLQQIAQNTGILAGRVAASAADVPGDESWKYAPTISFDNGGGFATGLERVPYDNFPAWLHAGEMVVPAAVADTLRTAGLTSALMGRPSFELPAPRLPELSVSRVGLHEAEDRRGDGARVGDVQIVINISGAGDPEAVGRVVEHRMQRALRSLRGGRGRYMLGLDG